MEFTLPSLCIAALLPSMAIPMPQAETPVAVEAVADETPYVHDFEFVPAGEFDPASVPTADGIVWYGTWEAAMAEKELTGKPVMLHMGSPRCPAQPGYCVPGTW